MTSTINPSDDTPYLKHVDVTKRLKEVSLRSIRCSKIAEMHDFDRILVNKSLNEQEIGRKIVFTQL